MRTNTITVANSGTEPATTKAGKYENLSTMYPMNSVKFGADEADAQST